MLRRGANLFESAAFSPMRSMMQTVVGFTRKVFFSDKPDVYPRLGDIFTRKITHHEQAARAALETTLTPTHRTAIDQVLRDSKQMHNSLRNRITAASTLIGAVSVFSPTAFLIWAGSHVAMHLRARNYILNRCLQAEADCLRRLRSEGSSLPRGLQHPEGTSRTLSQADHEVVRNYLTKTTRVDTNRHNIVWSLLGTSVVVVGVWFKKALWETDREIQQWLEERKRREAEHKKVSD